MSITLVLNIVLAIIAAVLLFKFIRYKKFCASEFNRYEERLEDELSRRNEAELKYQNEAANINSKNSKDSETITSLLAEIATLRREKEEELKLRLESEKQVELAMQKTDDAENRVSDWEMIQSSNFKDTSEIVAKATDDLYQKLAGLFTEKFASKSNVIASQKAKSDSDLEAVLNSAGLEASADYFMNSTIPEEVKKSVPCEAFVIFGEENCAIIDNKSTKFFQEFADDKARNEPEAYEIFKKKIDRYLAYLTNPKYRKNAINYFAANDLISPKANSTLVMLLNSENDVNEFKGLGENYSQILQKHHIILHSLSSIISLISPPL